MKTVIHTKIGQRTADIIQRVMKEKNCKKSEAFDHIVVERVIRRLKDRT